jgi:hypothetical protein
VQGAKPVKKEARVAKEAKVDKGDTVAPSRLKTSSENHFAVLFARKLEGLLVATAKMEKAAHMANTANQPVTWATSTKWADYRTGHTKQNSLVFTVMNPFTSTIGQMNQIKNHTLDAIHMVEDYDMQK